MVIGVTPQEFRDCQSAEGLAGDVNEKLAGRGFTWNDFAGRGMVLHIVFKRGPVLTGDWLPRLSNTIRLASP